MRITHFGHLGHSEHVIWSLSELCMIAKLLLHAMLHRGVLFFLPRLTHATVTI